jgi:hypothetical protein
MNECLSDRAQVCLSLCSLSPAPSLSASPLSLSSYFSLSLSLSLSHTHTHTYTHTHTRLYVTGGLTEEGHFGKKNFEKIFEKKKRRTHRRRTFWLRSTPRFSHACRRVCRRRPRPLLRSSRLVCVVVTGPFSLFLLRNHFITEIFLKKKSGDVNVLVYVVKTCSKDM